MFKNKNEWEEINSEVTREGTICKIKPDTVSGGVCHTIYPLSPCLPTEDAFQSSQCSEPFLKCDLRPLSLKLLFCSC